MKKTKQPLKRQLKYASHLLSAFLASTTCITQSNALITCWEDLFNADEPRLQGAFGKTILGHLDEHSLRRVACVSKSCKKLVEQIHDDRLNLEKQQLFSLIVEVTKAEANEVQRTHDRLERYLERASGELPSDFHERLHALKARFLQPESLIRRANEALFNQLLSTSDLQASHLALKPLVKLIEDLGGFIAPDSSLDGNNLSLREILSPLKTHYEAYLAQLLVPTCERAAHLHPKALLSGEGFLGSGDGITSYRISQEMARSLLSKDEYGLSARTNTQGSHAVCFKRSLHNALQGVHFKGNTTNTGLAVGRESAIYELSQILFHGGTSLSLCGRIAASALLSLNEVEIKTPSEGTDTYRAFHKAVRDGKTSEEFFADSPLYEREFTQQSPAHVLQAGYHVEGISLEDFIKEVEQKICAYDDIDLASFSEHIFLSLLTNPTDGTPGNFMLRRGPNLSSSSLLSTRDKFFVVGIDNDMNFELGDVFSTKVYPKPGEQKEIQQKHCVRVKNSLYCLSLMNDALAPQTIQRILKLNPELIALQWLRRLQEQDTHYRELQKAEYAPDRTILSKKPYLSQDQIHDLHLPFLLDPDFVPQVCDTIRKVQTYLKDHRAATL